MPKTTASPERAAQPMPQSFARLHIHLVFSTKNREPLITEAVRIGYLEEESDRMFYPKSHA
jgi:hypothetical protein